MRKKFTSYPAAKHPKHSKSAITDMREKPADLFSCKAQASTLAPTLILRTWGFFTKFSVPVESIIPRS